MRNFIVIELEYTPDSKAKDLADELNGNLDAIETKADVHLVEMVSHDGRLFLLFREYDARGKK